MKLSDTIMVNAMKRILVPLLILLFCFVNTSKADNLAPEKIEGARAISTVTAKLLFDKGYHFIDVRGLDDFKIGHIPGAYHLSIKSDFDEQNLSAIVKKTQPVVIYCNGILCMGSSIAIKKAIDWGWSNIFYYREGIRDWKQQGYSVRSINP
jgi:rhodanese-related sulfurtransferase